MTYPRLAARLYNTPLMIEPGKAEVIESVFRAFAEGRSDTLAAFEAKTHAAPPVPMEKTDNGYSLAPGGVAVLPIHGTLVQRADNLDAASGLVGYNRIAAQFQAATADSKVRGIVLEFDSHGGEVAGVFELAAQIMAATKPVYAHANESAFSAAYALAVGAEQIWIAQTGMVGSIGVLMMHVDQSQADAKKGMVYTPIYAGAHKLDLSSRAPLSDSARARAQEQVDRLYAIFADHVATAQGISVQAVLGTEAGVLTPGQAMDIGLANGQASLNETIQRMQASFSTEFTGYSRPSRALSERSNIMTTEKTPGHVAATEDQLQAAEARGRAAAEVENTKKLADAQTASAAAAQARISGILSHAEAAGRRTQAEHLAFKTALSIEDAAAILATGPKDQAGAGDNQFAREMARQGNAKVAADGGDDPKGSKVVAPNAANVYAFRAQCVRKARGQAAA